MAASSSSFEAQRRDGTEDHWQAPGAHHKLRPQGNHPAWALGVSSSPWLSFLYGPGIPNCGKYYTQKRRGRENGGMRTWRMDVSGCQVRTSSSRSVRVNVNDLWGRPTQGEKEPAHEKGEPKTQNKGGLFKCQDHSWALLSFLPLFLALLASDK